VVDIDLKSFFDHVNHDPLMHLVGRKVRDKRLLRLIGESLRAPMRLRDGREEPRQQGTPQGGPLSSLLASVTAWIERELKLPVNREKSGHGPSDGTSLLGFRLETHRTIRLAPKSVERLKTRVRELWDARQSLTCEEQREQWRRYIEGW